MIVFPAGAKVWIAGGVTDMRCWINSLVLKVQQGLGRDPNEGEIFCFWGRQGCLIKVLRRDGVGMSLHNKRLEAWKFIWLVRARAGPLCACLGSTVQLLSNSFLKNCANQCFLNVTYFLLRCLTEGFS
jgi:hypothetical protein